MIKYKAVQVAPAELESLLLSHPCVADVAVIGSPDEDAGEVPHAFVVPSGEVSDTEIMEFVASRVAVYKKVRRVTFVESIPKSASGKILRRELRARTASG
jgi:4-coumarate--CoA ligase